MKVRFFCDLSPWHSAHNAPQAGLAATTRPGPLTAGAKRVAFDVDFPSDLLREYDFDAPVTELTAELAR